MPYTKSSKLPSYVEKLSDKLKEDWINIFNATYEKHGEAKAMLVANTWLKKQLPHKKMIKRSVITLQLDTANGFVKRSSDGYDYVNFVLNSNVPHRDGKRFSEDMLKKWAQTINSDPKMIGGGDIDHILYDKLLNSNISDDMVRSVLKSKKGIAKMVQAVYDQGKLWVRAIVDKRYKKLIEKSKGVSAEAFCVWDDSDTVALDGELLGFTFNVNTTPADYHAGVVA